MTREVRPDGHGQLATIDFATLFASRIHEIKNLLFLLIGSLDETIDEYGHVRDGAALSSKLSLLKFNGNRINDQLVQLLSLYRMAQGSYAVDVDYHAVNEFIEDMTLETRPLMAASNLVLEADTEDDLCWFFDRGIADGIISNAIHNGMRHAKSVIRLSAHKEADWLAIRVEDDGPGFPAKLLESTDYLQDSVISMGKTGLGLYFSATMASLHTNKGNRGSIKLANGGSLGGAVFTLSLP
jgi:signal transduction histidine kinase